MLFTKNKRSSFQSKRSHSQYVVDNLDHAVISRKPSYTKPTPVTPSINKVTHSMIGQPTQLILPDLTQMNGEPSKQSSKQKQRTPRNSLKETSAEPEQITIEFKSVKDRVAYFSSKVNDKLEPPGTPLHQIITRTLTPATNTITTCNTTTTTTTITTSSTVMTTSTPKAVPTIKSQVKEMNSSNKKIDSICLLSPLKSATNSSSNFLKHTTMSVSTSSLSSKSFLSKNNNANNCNSSNKNAAKVEVKTVLIGNSSENKISNLIQKFTKRK